jgi:hypothetical protein
MGKTNIEIRPNHTNVFYQPRFINQLSSLEGDKLSEVNDGLLTASTRKEHS